jgi:gamma-glutamylcyclotransferase
LKYAAYGSNLHPVRLMKRTGTARLLGTGIVDGLALRFHKRGNIDGSGKCNIVEQSEDRVCMAIFEIPNSGMAALDVEEGVGSGYARSSVDVSGFGPCLTYRAQASHIDDELLPFSWYKDLVLAGCRLHGFPNEYIEAIEAVEAMTDPDPARHSLHVRLLETLDQTL